MIKTMKVFTLSLFIICLISSQSSLHAAFSTHTDLASTCLGSKYIVIAKRLKTRKLANWAKARSYEVLESLQGDFKRGQKIEVFWNNGYRLQTFWSKPLEVDDTVVLFIKDWPNPQKNLKWLPKDTPKFSLSGLRVLSKGRVYRFEQFSNPGPMGPVPQGRDPYDVRQTAKKREHVDLPTFRNDLIRAIQQIKKYKKGWNIKDPLKRRNTIVKLFGDPLPPASDWDRNKIPHAYADHLAKDAIRKFNDLDDTVGAVEIYLRRGMWLGFFGHGLSLKYLWPVISDKSKSVALRVAALDFLQHKGRIEQIDGGLTWKQIYKKLGKEVRDEDYGPEFAQLCSVLKDPEKRVRREVAFILGLFLTQAKQEVSRNEELHTYLLKQRKTIEDQLIEQYKLEKAPRVRAEIIKALSDSERAQKELSKLTKTVSPLLFVPAKAEELVKDTLYKIIVDEKKLKLMGITPQNWLFKSNGQSGPGLQQYDGFSRRKIKALDATDPKNKKLKETVKNHPLKAGEYLIYDPKRLPFWIEGEVKDPIPRMLKSRKFSFDEKPK